jgi:hypothetical protein
MTTMPTANPAPASEAAVALARETVGRFPACFWFRRADAPVRSVADVELVVQRLRQHGDRRAWSAALEIERCL